MNLFSKKLNLLVIIISELGWLILKLGTTKNIKTYDILEIYSNYIYGGHFL